MSKLKVLITLTLILLISGCWADNSEESPLQRRMATIGHGSPRPFGAEKPSIAEEFELTRVLQPEFQIRATLEPNNISQFYYLSPKTGPSPILLVSPCSGSIYWSVSYVGPPETDQHAEATQIHWPVKKMIPGSPLFVYEGPDTQNFTIPAAFNLYRIEMRPITNSGQLDVKTRLPNTVLLYATSDASGHLPGNLITPTVRGGGHVPLLEFQQRWSRRRLIVSWNKSRADPDTSSYLLAVTSGAQLYPPTLCAAENILKKHPCPSSSTQQQRTEPEGLHCVRKNKLTLFGVKYNTTYYFTLYIMNTQTNVSNRVATESFRFQGKPPIILQNGRFATANLRKRDGFAIFRYRPRDNATTIFNILACGACSIKAKFRGPGFCLEEQIGGEFSLRAPALPAGKRFSIQLTASQIDLVKMSRVKIRATNDESIPYTDYMLQNSALTSNNQPWEYRRLGKCPPKLSTWCATKSKATSSSSSSSSSLTTTKSTKKLNNNNSNNGPCNSSPATSSIGRKGPTHWRVKPCPSSSSSSTSS